MRNSNSAMKSDYKKALELGIIGALVLCNVAFFVFRSYHLQAETIENKRDPIVVESPPNVRLPKAPTPPPRPSTPVPSLDPEVPPDATIEPGKWVDFGKLPPPPGPPPADDIVPFWAVQEKPELIGGIASIRSYLTYPEMARKIHMEGRTVVHVLVDRKGRPSQMIVLESAGFEPLDQAALKAISRLRWKPAMQRDKPVRVWVAIPVKFSLK